MTRNTIAGITLVVASILLLAGLIDVYNNSLYSLLSITSAMGLYALTIYAVLFDWFLPTHQDSDILDDSTSNEDSYWDTISEHAKKNKKKWRH